MCIRDRDRAAGRLLPEKNPEAFTGVIVGVRADEEGSRSKAVSYTHLRAHETVLDLVCRLLLEKKKNTSSSKIIVYIKTYK